MAQGPAHGRQWAMAIDPTTVWLRRELLRNGWHSRAITKMVQDGTWTRVRHGAYTDTARWRVADRDARHLLMVLAAVRQAGTGVAVSHTSALVVEGAPTWGARLDVVHLTRLDARGGRKEAGINQHRGVLEDGDVVEIDGLLVTSPTRTALDITTISPPESCVVSINDLLHRQRTSADGLRARYDAGIVNWPNTLSTDLVLRRCDERCESPGESRFWWFCHVNGLPMPVPQHEVPDPRRRKPWRLDFAWPALKLWIEFDGKGKYGADAATAAAAVLDEKYREDRIRELTGWVCLRVTWADLENPQRLLERIRRAMAVAAKAA